MRAFLLLFAVIVTVGCSNVRLAVYDRQKRLEYTREAREAFVQSETGKEMALKRSIIDTAQLFLGTRYKYGSADPRHGLDCSGLVYQVALRHQIELPRSSSFMAKEGSQIHWKKARPGDLVFFGDRGRINHVGIVERTRPRELWVIHSTTGRGVLTENVLKSSYWKRRLMFAVDFTTLRQVRDSVKNVSIGLVDTKL